MSSSNTDNLSDKRGNFMDRVQREAKPEDKDTQGKGEDGGSSKPKGAFLESTSDQQKRVVDKKAPSCGYRGG